MGHAIALKAVNRSAAIRSLSDPAPYARINARRPATPMHTVLSAHPVAHTPQRRTRASDERIMLQVTVDETLLDSFRRAMFCAREGLIQLLRVQPDPRHTARVKVWLGMSRSALHTVIELVLETLPEAEIGRIAPA
jgi:hypothetical protein